MKKYGRKWRRLKYIREKNRINRGELLSRIIKVPVSRVEFYYSNLQRIIDFESRKYKTNLIIHNVQAGTNNDDFLKNFITVRFQLKKKSEFYKSVK